jgi:5-methylcytosine-specific restriction enzyme A
MALSDLTVDAVLRAMAEFRELGREVFLERYGFGEARSYFVLEDGARYDSKAIAGAAHGFLRGRDPVWPKNRNDGRTVGAIAPAQVYGSHLPI